MSEVEVKISSERIESVLLLTYIITQSDHRLCAVEAWVKAHQQILELSTGWSIGEKDTTDDRLAR